MYPITEIPSEASERLEEVGSKDKFWYDNHSKLFKYGRENTGEHWSEKIACELSALLGLPHAAYEFASCGNRFGTTTANMVPAGGSLFLGNVLLVSFSDSYDGTQRYRSRQHTVGRVVAALGAKEISVPTDCPGDFQHAQPKDIFAGYILLDAWIGNTDRHHENWGLIANEDEIRLAPTFDHASSLGRELSDSVRAERLSTKDERYSVTAYARRAKSALYRTESDTAPLSTLDAYLEVAKKCATGAAYWSDRIARIAPAAIDNILAQVPHETMSEPAKLFVRKMLLVNQADICASGAATNV